MCTAGFGEPLVYSSRVRRAPGAASRRVRRRARQPVPRQRDARHGRGRVAPADDAAPPHHGGPPARPVPHDEPVAALHDASLVRLLGHAGARGARAARRAHRVAELPPGHRGPNGRRPRTDDGGPRRRGRHRVPSVRRRHAGAGPHHGHLEQRRPDEGTRPAARGRRQAAHRARRRADRHRAPQRGRPGRPGHRPAWGSPTSCTA